MTLGERIKKARRSLDLTQQKFADQIGTTQNNIASYEIGRREPSSAAINNICKTFSISEDWLRTGEGEMFIQRSEEDELKQAIDSMLHGRNPSFKRRLINVLASLDDDDWLVLEEKVQELAEVAKKEPSVYADIPKTELHIAAEVASYEEELRLQAQAVEKLSVSDGRSGAGKAKMA